MLFGGTTYSPLVLHGVYGKLHRSYRSRSEILLAVADPFCRYDISDRAEVLSHCELSSVFIRRPRVHDLTGRSIHDLQNATMQQRSERRIWRRTEWRNQLLAGRKLEIAFAIRASRSNELN